MSDDAPDLQVGMPTRIINHIPLEDMAELWYWGVWKEPTPSPFSSSVLVVCTSRSACRRYLRGRTRDLWLLDDEERVQTEEQTDPDGEFLDDGDGESGSERGFELMSYEEFLTAVEQHKARGQDMTLLVNPRRDESDLRADAMFDLVDFLRRHRSDAPKR